MCVHTIGRYCVCMRACTYVRTYVCVSHCHLYHSNTVDTVKKYIIIQIPQSVHASVQQGILEVTHTNAACLWHTTLSRGLFIWCTPSPQALCHLKHSVTSSTVSPEAFRHLKHSVTSSTVSPKAFRHLKHCVTSSNLSHLLF